jgi:hypothetical protein
VYWTHSLTLLLLQWPFELWRGLSFWPWLYYQLFNPNAPGRSVWQIITDPKDRASTRTKMKNQPSEGVICPLWSKLLVFSTYQVHGAFAHLHQRNNDDVADALSDAAGPSLPRLWDPLRLNIPYQHLSARLFKPPDCYVGRWITFISIIMIYLVPLCRGAAHLTYLRLFPPPPTACSRKRTCRSQQCTALATTNPTARGHTSVTFDTDGIPFIVDNSATCIITNERSLFIGQPHNC